VHQWIDYLEKHHLFDQNYVFVWPRPIYSFCISSLLYLFSGYLK
jgi:hypothetical protein